MSLGKRKEKGGKTRRNKNEDVEEEPIHFRLAKDDAEISRINKKIIDLNLHDSEDRTGTRQEYKFRLPEGAEKIEKVGYE